MQTTVDFTVSDQVARVRFHTENGVHLLGPSVRQQLAAVLKDIQQQPELAVVVFESTGRTFLAGADIHELKSLNPTSAKQLSREGQELMNGVARLQPVTLAAIHASCAGGGCELSLACDMRMMAEGARLGLPEVSIGVVPGWGGTVRAVQLFGGAVARRMILAAELFQADEALRLGIVDHVAPDDDFRHAVQQRVQRLLTGAPGGQARASRLIADFQWPCGEPAAPEQLLAQQLEAEAEAFAACYTTTEPYEGMQAFLDKRPPHWSV